MSYPKFSTNSSHRIPAYFEWFYFQFVTEGGTAINMVLYETDIFGLSQESYLSLTVKLPGQLPRYLRRPIGQGSIVCGGDFLHVADLIVEDNNAIRFDIPLPDNNRFSGTIYGSWASSP
jgi:hypothetical protein